MSSSFTDREIIEDLAFLFEGTVPPDVVKRLHLDGLPDMSRLADAETLYFVIGSYSAPQKTRVEAVRDRLSDSVGDEAFMLEEIDPDVDVWENFYVKFRVMLKRCHYVIGVFEDNYGGHELELGEADLSATFVLKRDYSSASIEDDLEREKYDAMLSTLFDLLERRGQLHQWTNEAELEAETQRIAADLGNASPP